MRSFVYLIQTDTTVGLVSKDEKRLNKIKQSQKNKKLIRTYCCFKEALKDIRAPKKFRKKIRRSPHTTFIYPDLIARRVVFEKSYKDFLARFGWMYSTSANLSQKDIDINWAKEVCDVIVGDEFIKKNPSAIFKITKKRLIKIR